MTDSLIEQLKNMGQFSPNLSQKNNETKSVLKSPKDATVLIVDDEQSVLDILELDLSHYTVFKALDGPDALKLYKKLDIDLVVTDMRMAPWDGCELSEKILTLNPGQSIIVRSGQLGNYDPIEILQTSRPFRIIPKTEEGDQVLFQTIDEVLFDTQCYKRLIKGEQTGAETQLPGHRRDQYITPSIVMENTHFCEGGKWAKVYPLFSNSKDFNRPVLGYVHITPRYALDAIFEWTKKKQLDWEKKHPYERAEKLCSVAGRLEKIVLRAISQKNTHNPNHSDLARLEHISESAGIAFPTLCEGLLIDANYMMLSKYVLDGIFGKANVTYDSTLKNIKAKGINTVVTRATMTSTPACHDIPSVLGGNGLIRRGDLHCPAITHLFLELMHQEGMPVQQFHNITREEPTIANRYLYRMSDHFDFMGHIAKGLQIVYADLIQYFIDTNQKQKVDEYQNLFSKGEYDKVEKLAFEERQEIKKIQKKMMNYLPAVQGVGLFVAHKGFASVRYGADLKYAAEQNAHGGICFPTSCKRTDIIAVDDRIFDDYVQEHIKAIENLLNKGMVKRPHDEWLDNFEVRHMDRRIILGSNQNTYMGEIIWGGFQNKDRSKPPVGILYPEYMKPNHRHYKNMINLVGAEGHCQHVWIIPIKKDAWESWLRLLENSARETQMPLKPGGAPMFLEATTFFDPNDTESIQFHNQFTLRNIASGSMPLIRTTHVHGHLPWVLNDEPPMIINSTLKALGKDAGMIGMHERQHFLKNLTDNSLIISDPEKLKECMSA